jgi:hypothetical protein
MARHIALVIISVLALNACASSQVIRNAPELNEVPLKAFSYFERITNRQYDAFLRSIRPSGLTPELRATALRMLPKNDLVNPNADEVAKLETLGRILKYHQRDSVIEIKVLRSDHTATAVFLAGAAVLITEPALKVLTADELQAVVAHELGHEYYWNRFEAARENKNYLEVQELELRCDGIAVITLNHVGINPANLIYAITKLNRHNEHPGSANYVGFNDRVAFIQRMIELVSGR